MDSVVREMVDRAVAYLAVVQLVPVLNVDEFDAAVVHFD